MTMAYTTNEKVDSVRIAAIRMMQDGKSSRATARHFGYNQSTMVRWYSRRHEAWHKQSLPTRSSRPHNSPRRTSRTIEGLIIAKRKELKRCTEVVYESLKRDGVQVSVSTVKRVLHRYGLLQKRSPWKKTRRYPIRPDIAQQGDLVEIDTIHLGLSGPYVYTALDVYSRYGYALLSKKATCAATLTFLKHCKNYFPFKINCLQTDNGPEFGKWFTDHCACRHRHNHVRKPNENGHLERFNRTIQEEMPRHHLCIALQKDVARYLKEYNTKRLHMGIKFKTPHEMVTRK